MSLPVALALLTAGLNIPRNERLARLDACSPEAVVYWAVYVREWTCWNHVRTLAALVSAACAIGAGVLHLT